MAESGHRFTREAASVRAAGRLGVLAVPELLRRRAEVLLVEREGVGEVRRPQGRVLLVRHRRVVVVVRAEDLVAEGRVVARVQHGDVPHVVQPLGHRDLDARVGGQQEDEALVLGLHGGEVAPALVAEAVLQVETLAGHVPRDDLVPELCLFGRHVHRTRQQCCGRGHEDHSFRCADKCNCTNHHITCMTRESTLFY